MDDLRTQATSITLSDLQDSRAGSTDLKASLTPTYKTSKRQESPKRDSKRGFSGISRVGDFRSSFLKPSMWPEMSPADQFTYKSELKKLHAAYSNEVRETATYKSQLSAPVKSCLSCTSERRKREATEEALSQAVELTKILLQEVRRLDSEVVKVTRSKS